MDVLVDLMPVIDCCVKVSFADRFREVKAVDDDVDVALVRCGMNLAGHIEPIAVDSVALLLAVVHPNIKQHPVRLCVCLVVSECQELADYRCGVPDIGLVRNCHALLADGFVVEKQ